LCGYRPFYAHCGRDCGFDEGHDCEECQELLFKCIQQGVYSFPDQHWAGISDDAKDLIQHLLVKNPYQRYTAEQVLLHPWLSKDLSAAAPLATPQILCRNNSVRELGMFAENANAVNRMIQIQRHISVNEFGSTTIPSLLYSGRSHANGSSSSGVQNSSSSLANVKPAFELMKLDDDDDDDEGAYVNGLGRWSEEEEEDRSTGRWNDSSNEEDIAELRRVAICTLSIPGKSRLARRRAFGDQQMSECSIDSGNGSNGSSPPET
jgi:serine/threonine protein kinase